MKTPALPKSIRINQRRNGSRPLQQLVTQSTVPAAIAEAQARTIAPTRQGAARFRCEAPTAFTVKLVADFTGWEKRPLDLVRADDGVWRLTVALPPGRYTYRFMIDGEWCDDPACQYCEPNPFGTRNAVIEVA